MSKKPTFKKGDVVRVVCSERLYDPSIDTFLYNGDIGAILSKHSINIHSYIVDIKEKRAGMICPTRRRVVGRVSIHEDYLRKVSKQEHDRYWLMRFVNA